MCQMEQQHRQTECSGRKSKEVLRRKFRGPRRTTILAQDDVSLRRSNAWRGQQSILQRESQFRLERTQIPYRCPAALAVRGEKRIHSSGEKESFRRAPKRKE